MVFNKKSALILLFICLVSVLLWSQSSEPFNPSLERGNIENMLCGTWTITPFTLPRCVELEEESGNLKWALSISRTGGNADINDNGEGVFWGSFADNRKFQWEIVPPFTAFTAVTLRIENKDQSEPVLYEMLLVDHETMIATFIENDGENQNVYSAIWKKINW